jgi:ATP-binding cassette, subfamily B, bacterial MsbA
MHHFVRILRRSLRYRWTLLSIVASSFLVAVFWGANLGTVYPLANVVLQKQSIPDWLDSQIQGTQRSLASLEQQRRETLAAGANISPFDVRLQAERRWLERCRYFQPLAVRFLPSTPFKTLGLVVGVLLLGSVVKSVFLVINVVLVERLGQRLTFDLRKEFYRKTLRMEMAHFGKERTATLLSHFTHDVDAISGGMLTIFGRAIREPLKIVACLVGAGYICWRLLAFSLILTPLAVWAIHRMAQSLKRANRRAMDEMSRLYARLTESLEGIAHVKAYTMERRERRRFHLVGKEYYHRTLRIAQRHALTKPATELMGISVICVALLAGGYLVLNEETHLLGVRIASAPLDFETLMTFFALLAGISDPFRKISDVYHELQRAAAAADRVGELMQRTPAIVSSSGNLQLSEPLRNIEVRSVSYHYQGGPPVLCDISMSITAGETIAIVGANGCGKSTLLSLLLRFHDPDAGIILWNGVDIRAVELNSLRGKIAYVSQNASLFDDSVANNIRYGRPEASLTEVIAAARKAHAHDFIENKLAAGYETIVGPGGKLLSGGQRQRIALARAILRDPELLLLDEATSQIDLESEQLIQSAMVDFIHQRTTILVTHRIESLRLARRILVMEAGRIVASGTHTELLCSSPYYRALHQVPTPNADSASLPSTSLPRLLVG